MLVLVLGVLGADIFLPRVSLLILLAGLIILFQGWTFFRAVLFPWAFLILMIPIPALIINRVTFPLQLLAARLSAALLELVGVVVYREGNIISLASGPLDVAEACSGIRSLLTLVTLAIVYGYLMETRKWVRVALVCLTVPIAVVANSFRVFGTGLLMQSGFSDEAEGVSHALAALLIFTVAMMMLFAVHRVISLIWKSGPAAPRNIAHLEEQPAQGIRMKAGSFRSPRQPLRGFKIGTASTRALLVSGAWPRGSQRVAGKVLSDRRFDSHEPQRRRDGAANDSDA